MKKLLALLLSLVMVLSFAACSGEKATEQDGAEAVSDDFKVGFIFLHDENSTYDKNFIDAAIAATEAMGLSESQVMFKKNIDESAACYDAAADLADAGCDLVFADSFGHEDFMIQAAKEYPEVTFCHATGTKAHTENLPNFYNAFASIYEGRYLVGVAAGLKINDMIEKGEITAEQAKMGYVGAYPYAEVKSGLTSFFLGARSVCPSVTMDVSTLTPKVLPKLVKKQAFPTLHTTSIQDSGAPTQLSFPAKSTGSLTLNTSSMLKRTAQKSNRISVKVLQTM